MLIEAGDTMSIEARVWAEYRALLGKRIRVRRCYGFTEDDTHREFRLHPPVLARVIETKESDVLNHSVSGWIDPLWNIEPLEARPELEGAQGLYVYGNSWNASGAREVSTGDWEED